MRVVAAAFLTFMASTACAFTTTPSFVSVGRHEMVNFMSAVAEPEAAEAVEEQSAPAPQAASPSSGLTMKAVRKTIDNLTKENFESSLATLEPFLKNEAGATIYAKSMRRLARQAKVLGVELPASYAVDAKATSKKRAKQDAFIQTKEEERLAAEAEAAEAAEDAAAPVEEEAVPSE